MATSRSKRVGGGRGRVRDDELLIQAKYSNKLPDVPFAPKFLEYPFDPNRFVTYNHTRLEKSHKYELHVPSDLGVEVDLIDGITQGNPDAVDLDPRDEALLKDAPNLSEKEKKRNETRGKDFSWMRKTIYMNGQGGRTYGKQTETSNENKVLGGGGRRMSEIQNQDNSREKQIRTIENQFEVVKPDKLNKLRHPNKKKDVYITESVPILPDFENWKFAFAQGVFDVNPAPKKNADHSAASEREFMAQSVLHGENAGLFWPTEQTFKTRKRRREDDDDIKDGEEYEFRKLREYTFNIKKKEDSKEDVFFFAQRPDESGDPTLYYNPLLFKVQLSRRRMTKHEREAKESGNKIEKQTEFLTVKHRGFDASDLAAQQERLNELDYDEGEAEVDDDDDKGENPPAIAEDSD